MKKLNDGKIEKGCTGDGATTMKCDRDEYSEVREGTECHALASVGMNKREDCGVQTQSVAGSSVQPVALYGVVKSTVMSAVDTQLVCTTCQRVSSMRLPPKER